MRPFKAEFIAPVFASMSQLMQLASEHIPLDAQVSHDLRERAKQVFEGAKVMCDEYDLVASGDAAERFKEEADWEKFDYAGLRNDCFTFQRTVEGEMKRRAFFLLERGDEARFDQDKPYGDTVFDAFPSSRHEAKEAGNCIALDRYSASVHHSMLALEPGLRALANYVGLSLPKQTWASVIEKIEKRVDEEAKKRKPPSALNLQFVSEAATQFTYVREAWRNHSAHGRARYDRYQAMGIFEHTGTLLRALAPHVQEPP